MSNSGYYLGSKAIPQDELEGYIKTMPAGTDVDTFLGTKGIKLGNPTQLALDKEGLLGLTNNTWGNLGQVAGLAGAGYDLYSNLFGDKHDMYKTQMSALKQNMANVAEDRAAHRAFQNNFGGGINSAFKGGLAASAATKL